VNSNRTSKQYFLDKFHTSEGDWATAKMVCVGIA